MNKPSTVVTVPVAIVQAIPKRGTMPMTMEITSIIGSNSPPYYCSDGFQSYAQSYVPPYVSTKDEAWADGSVGPLSLLRLERCIHRLAIFGRQRDLLFLRTHLFLHEG